MYALNVKEGYWMGPIKCNSIGLFSSVKDALLVHSNMTTPHQRKGRIRKRTNDSRPGEDFVKASLRQSSLTDLHTKDSSTEIISNCSLKIKSHYTALTSLSWDNTYFTYLVVFGFCKHRLNMKRHAWSFRFHHLTGIVLHCLSLRSVTFDMQQYMLCRTVPEYFW